MRYAMKLDRLIRPFMFLLGATKDSAYVEVIDGSVRIRMGIFDETIPISEIERVGLSQWTLLGGLGIRMTLDRIVAPIGSTRNVVEIKLKTPRKVRIVMVPFKALSLRTALEDPEAFVRDLEPRLQARLISYGISVPAVRGCHSSMCRACVSR